METVVAPSPQRLVAFTPEDAAWSPIQKSFLEEARTCSGQVEPVLAWLKSSEPLSLAAQPGAGNTLERLRFFAAAAAMDVTAARVLEPHLDAVSILTESRQLDSTDGSGRTWGVFASEGPSATLAAQYEDDQWVLSGTKPWCSLGGRLTHALITAPTVAGESRLFEVALQQRSIRSAGAPWISRGLADVESGPLVMDRALATAVGETGWYLDRPGFRWGGIGVAACWWGGCVPLFSAIVQKSKRGGMNPLAASQIGRLYRTLESARLLLERSAADIDDAESAKDPDHIAVLAHTVRGVVADAVDDTLAATRDILGPAALALDEPVARRFSDLEIYASQYHRGLDDASLATHLKTEGAWW